MGSESVRPPSLLRLPSYLISQVAKFGYHDLEDHLAEHNLSLTHHAILTALHDFGPLSQQQLADSLHFDKSHLVGRIDHLEQHGLVKRLKDTTDRRRHRITLTPPGHDFIIATRPIAEKSQQRVLSALTNSERKNLTSLLRRVLDVNDAARIAAEHRTQAESP